MAAAARVAEHGAGLRPPGSTVAPPLPCPDRRRGRSPGPRPVRPAEPLLLTERVRRSAPRPVRLVPPGYSMPRRGGALRLLAVVVTTVGVVCGLAVLGQGAGVPDVPGAVAEVRVGAGETLWDVADRVAPGSDEQAVVARIRELNGLTGSAVRPGQELLVPDGA
ncbi:MAG: LysM peptidoglycan-binding domain-containing protein [Actinomycetota bacterium]|nr:LysM peptidoglycan-binding domain-containing protein [Actinomycetota bacterium]